MTDFFDRLSRELSRLDATDSRRVLTELAPVGLCADHGGRRLLNLSSNDYLGLSARGDLSSEFFAGFSGGCGYPGMSAVSSRLLTGNHPEYALLEADLSTLYGRAALATNSGYHANVGLFAALCGAEDLILSDALNHASIIDGVRLSGARRETFPHLGYGGLEELLAARRDEFRDVFIVTESLFSMDGDRADLARLVELKKRFNCVLILDEAHAVGVFGGRGLGLAEAAGVLPDIDVLVGTFGKALASAGAFIIASPVVREFLVNRMRTLIYSTGLPPMTVAWSRFTLGKAVGMARERAHLADLSERLRRGIAARGGRTAGTSQIVPLIIGSNGDTVRAAQVLRAAGFLAFPIRPPTVPEGSSRIRFSLNAGLEPGQIDALLAALP